MRVVVQQVDLDTCAAAFVLGVSPGDDILVAPAGASREDLDDAEVVCIEAGGSGETDRNNFDHHRQDGPIKPACRQALEASGRRDPWLERLVEYAERVDRGEPSCGTGARSAGQITLSELVSGIRLTIADPAEQLREALHVLRVVWDEGVNPGEPLRPHAEWERFLAARHDAAEKLAAAAPSAHLFLSRSGLRVGFVSVSVPGALGLLYASGCEIAIAHRPARIGDDGRTEGAKFTIGGRDGRRVSHLLPLLDVLEAGWGGPASRTIIGSPRGGTRLTPEIVKTLVRDHV
jgi:hypothetical protein